MRLGEMGRGVRHSGFCLLIAGIILVLAGCNDGDDPTATSTATGAATAGETAETNSENTVTSILASDGRFDTLLQILEVAEVSSGPPGSTETIGSAAQVMGEPGWNNTLFAPTDEAFESLDDDTMAMLLSDADAATQFVRRHVVLRIVMSDELETGEIQTIRGSVQVLIEGDVVHYGGAEVIEADRQASNGVIHVIDGVVATE